MTTKYLFKPMAPYEVNNISKIKNIPFPLYASPIFSGVKCLFRYGELVDYNCNLIPNPTVQKRFTKLKDVCNRMRITFQGVLYSPSVEKKKLSLLTHSKVNNLGHLLPTDLRFFCFDSVFEEWENKGFKQRHDIFRKVLQDIDYTAELPQSEIETQKELYTYLESCLINGFDGIIVRSKEGIYIQGIQRLNKELSVVAVRKKALFRAHIKRIIPKVIKIGEEKYKVADCIEAKINGTKIFVPIESNLNIKKDLWDYKYLFLYKPFLFRGMVLEHYKIPKFTKFYRIIP